MKTFLLAFVGVLLVLNLLTGILAGLGRMGWSMTYLPFFNHHGAIMVGGFLGAVIAIEKIIPLHKKIFFLIPLCNLGSILLFAFAYHQAGATVLILAATGLVSVFLIYFLRHQDLSNAIMLAGAVCFLTGNAFLLVKQFYPLALPWWIAFLLLIIVGERLELIKFLPVTRSDKLVLLSFLGAYIISLMVPFHGAGTLASGTALMLVSLWLMRFDVIRINLSKNGYYRFSAVALLAGYISLLLTGLFIILLPSRTFGYDAVVHTFFLGFVFNMIFAHGPVILPGVLGIRCKPFHAVLYIPFVALMMSLLLRLLSDLTFLDLSFQRVSGYISGLSILLYFLSLVLLTMARKTNEVIL